MKKESSGEYIAFNVIVFWEFIALNLLMVSLILITLYFVFVPLLGEGTASAVFSMYVGIFVGILFQRKRMRIISIEIFETDAFYFIYRKENIKRIAVYAVLFQKLPTRILRINQALLLISPVQKGMFDKISQEQKIAFRNNINILIRLSETLSKNIGRG